MRKIQSQGLGVNTLYGQLTVSLDLQLQGGVGLKQWYYSTDKTYSPDHGVNPLIIKPILTAYDPDKKESLTPTLTSVTWTETDVDGVETTFTSTITGYIVSSDGTLTMTKNVEYDKPLSLRARVIYTDPRNGAQGEIEESLSLVTSLSADERYHVSVAPYRREWNPLSGETPTVTFEATAQYGKNDATAKVKFFWYYVHDGSEVLVDDADDPCLAYVSGQHTTTLTLNLDYESEALNVVCRIAADTEATAPDVDFVSGRASALWNVPTTKGITYTPNGETARTTIASHTFGVIYRQGNSDVDDDVARERIVTEWSMKRTDQAETERVGLGLAHTVTVDESLLRNNVGEQMVVSPVGYLLGTLKAVADSDTGVVVTQVVEGVEKMVIGRTTD